MKLKMIKEYFGIPSQSILTCLMKIVDEDGKILFLVDNPMGARELHSTDEVLYESPYYNKEKHDRGQYTWLDYKRVRETDIKTNQDARHLLSKEEF